MLQLFALKFAFISHMPRIENYL